MDQLAVLLPLKDLTRAKQRLAVFLNPAQRQALAWAMFEDVAEALVNSRAGRIVTVTAAPEYAERASRFGWEVIHEQHQISESASVDRASSVLERQGVRSVLRLPADIPLIQPADIDTLIDELRVGYSNILVPSADETGTNALLRTPPTAFPSRFGPNSRIKHQAEAGNVGITLRIVANLRIAVDVDDPSDLSRLQESGLDCKTATYRFLAQNCLLEKLTHLPCQQNAWKS